MLKFFRRRTKALAISGTLIVIAVAGSLELTVFPVYVIETATSKGTSKEQPRREHITIAFIDFLDSHSGLIVAAATVFVAYFTFSLRDATKLLWEAAERQRREARRTTIANIETAKAARQSANTAERTLTDLERPIVYGYVREPGLEWVTSAYKTGFSINRSTLKLAVANYGKNPSFIRRIRYRISTAPTGQIIGKIDPRLDGGRDFPVGVISVQGDPYFESTNLRLSFMEEEDDLSTGKRIVWITGFVRYDDIFRTHYINGFTFFFDRISGVFIRQGGTDYNYERTEDESDIPSPSED